LVWGSITDKKPLVPSLKKIAADLGVSYTLVSKVLSGRMGTTGVTAEKREAILKRAQELDYQPNRLAVALKQGRKGSLGIFFHSLGVPGSELSYRFVRQAASSLADHDTRLWLRFFSEDNELLELCRPSLKRELDGLLIAGEPHPAVVEKLLTLEEKGLPVVFANSRLNVGDDRVVNIQVDNEMQGYLPTQHLIELGSRRIAVFRVPDTFRVSGLRYAGFQRALQEKGIKEDPALVVPVDNFWCGSGFEGMAKLLKTGKKFDAIVAPSDALALGAINYLARHSGIPIKDWPRITGVDDSPMTETSLLPITSATAEMESCASAAVQTLLDKIEGKEVASQRILPRLVARESSLKVSMPDTTLLPED
jgi:LacI family transcriptional regulator